MSAPNCVNSSLFTVYDIGSNTRAKSSLINTVLQLHIPTSFIMCSSKSTVNTFSAPGCINCVLSVLLGLTDNNTTSNCDSSTALPLSVIVIVNLLL